MWHDFQSLRILNVLTCDMAVDFEIGVPSQQWGRRGDTSLYVGMLRTVIIPASPSIWVNAPTIPFFRSLFGLVYK